MRRWRAATAALATAALLAACSGDSSMVSKTTTSTGASTYLFPTYLPPAFKVVQGGVQVAGRAHRAYGFALGRKAGEGAYDGLILVTAIDAAADRSVSPAEKDTIVDINGARARYHDATIDAAVDWFADGAAIAVAGPPGSGPAVLEVARNLTGKGVAALRVKAVPDGYAKIAEAHTTGHTPEANRQIRIANVPKNTSTITITTSATNVPLVFAVGGGDHVEPLDVRGHDALTSSRTRTIQGGSFTESIIVWYEQPGALVSIISNTAPTELAPIANGLASISEEVWRQLVPSG